MFTEHDANSISEQFNSDSFLGLSWTKVELAPLRTEINVRFVLTEDFKENFKRDQNMSRFSKKRFYTWIEEKLPGIAVLRD